MNNIRYINDSIARDIAYIGPAENITSTKDETTTAEEIVFNGERTYDAFKMLNTGDVAKTLCCSLATARVIMSRQDFPLIKVGKNYRVSELAFAHWLTNTYDNIKLTNNGRRKFL